MNPATLPTVLDTRVVTGAGGGPEKTILNSPRYLQPLGYRMLCGYLTPPHDPGYAEIEAKAKRYQAPLVSIPDRGPHDWRVLRDLIRLCRRENVQIWHGHDYKTNALGLVVKRFHRMRLVTTVHGWVEQTQRTPLYYRIDKWCLPRYEKVICVSRDLDEECRRIGVRDGQRLLIENAIDTEDYQRRQSITEAKRKLGLPSDCTLIGAVGRLSEEKGFDVLLHAVQPLLQADPSLRVMIVGEGNQRARLESLITEMNLRSQVTLPGWRSDVRDVFEAMDVYVLSSRREGLPNVLLEAMALEVPVAATAVNGVPRLIRDAIDGLLVPSEDPTALRQAISRLLHDAALRTMFAAAGRKRVVEAFSFAARMKTLADLYDSMLQRRS